MVLKKRKEKVFRGKTRRHKLVPGRYGIWVRMIGLGEKISPISRKEKRGIPILVFDKLLQQKVLELGYVLAISKRREFYL